MVTSIMKKLDLFGKTVGFRIEGQSKLRTFSGMVISISLVFTVLVLCVHRFAFVYSGHQRYFVEHRYDEFFEGRALNEREQSALSNFTVGFGFLSDTSYDVDPADQKEFGIWKVYQYGVEIDEWGKYSEVSKELTTTSCDERDFSEALPDTQKLLSTYYD